MHNLNSYFKKITSHQVFNQLSWYTFGQLAVQFFSFCGIIVTARYLGPSNVGLYSFVQNYLAAFMTITIGMDFYFTWKVAKSEDKLRDLVEYFGHKMNVTLLLTFIGVSTAFFILPKDVAILATVMFLPLVVTSCTAFFQYSIATNRASIIAIVQAALAGALFLVKVLCVFLQAPLIAFVAINTFDTVAVAFALAVFYLRKKEVRQAFKDVMFPSLAKTFHFMYSIRMSLIAIALWQLILRIDQLVLATFSNAYELGIYSAAVKIAEVPNFLAGVLYTALVTHVASFAGNEDTHSKRRIRQVLILYAVIGGLIGAFVFAVAPYAIYFLYGAHFSEAIPVLKVYAASIPGMFVSLHYFSIYGAKEKHLFQSVLLVCTVFLNIGLIFILTPIYGLTGAAIATAVAYTSVAVAFYLHVR